MKKILGNVPRNNAVFNQKVRGTWKAKVRGTWKAAKLRMMESVHSVLRQILLGGTLEDKLLGSVAPFVDFNGSEITAFPSDLSAPGRSGALESRSIPGARFPKPSELHEPTARGRLLHYFANHELLAIETMAYVLLRFPDADPAFRKGVFRTLQDEQKHLKIYVGRMRELGVELGDVPLNLYFWNSLKSMKCPLDYVTQMSLTFEQANLDFALYHAKLFETEIEDLKTAEILRVVHDDEVKHVAHGLKWFNEWRTQGVDAEARPHLKSESEYESYLRLLPFPMTPRRAKGGFLFSAQSRRDAGMSEELIGSIEVSGGSRGKVPHLYFFNPQCEIEKAYPTLNQSMQTKLDDLAPLLLWLASEEDVLEMNARPELAWLKEIHGIKGELAEILTPDLNLGRYAAFDQFKPWGFSESAWAKLKSIEPKLRNPPPFDSELHREKLFSKSYWKKVLEQKDDPESAEVLIKSDQSTSGRGHQRIPRDLLKDQAFQKKLTAREKLGDAYTLEPYYDKVQDFSVQYELTKEGRVIEFEPRFFKVDSQFQYLGSYLGRVPKTSPLEKYREFMEKNRATWRADHARVIDHLKSLSYVGPFGIDALIYRPPSSQEGGLAIASLIEVNARLTMGRIAHEIESSLAKTHPKLSGFWVFLNERDLLKHGCRNFRDLEAKLRDELGSKFVATTPSNSQLTWTFAILDQSLVDRFF